MYFNISELYNDYTKGQEDILPSVFEYTFKFNSNNANTFFP